MKISSWQMFWMLATLEISMSIWLTLAPTIETAKQDAWLSLAVAGFIGLGVTAVMIKICQRHSAQTLVEFSQVLFGKWVGKLIGFLYIVMWYTVSADILRIFTMFIQQTLFHSTPNWLVSSLMVAAMVYITSAGGVEAIARFSEMAGPLLLISIFITFALNLPNLYVSLLLPIYADSGFLPILKGSLTNASFLGESMLIMMLTPFVSKPQTLLKPVLLALCVPSILAIVSSAMVTATFGVQIAETLFFPYFNMVRFINFLGFIQNMDVWIIFIWVFSVFVKLSVYLFINSYGTAQLFGIKKWRRMIVVTAPVIFALSIIPPNTIGIFDYTNHVWIKYVFPIFIVSLPIVFLLLGGLRGKVAAP